MPTPVSPFPPIDPSIQTVEAEVLRIIPEEVARNYQLVAFARADNALHVALGDPTNLHAIEAVDFLAKGKGWRTRYFTIAPEHLQGLLKKYQVLGEEVQEVLDVAKEEFGEKKDAQEKELAGPIEEVIKSAPISQMVTLIVRHAVENKASDIHIEPTTKESKIRYRVDGLLKTAISLPLYLHQAIVSRIKVLANLKLDETRIPQDGRIKMTIGKNMIDFRISTLPLLDQEKVVMRILDTSGSLPTLVKLGFRDRYITIIERNIRKPHGLFLITGPTGSGKTTTLYSVLAMRNEETVNISTLEDPIEYYLPGVNQSQVRSEIGFTFAAGLRALLRQDPNIIMVGEIRDTETGELAVHAGLTGHLVFSTLHTRNAFGAIPRLIDMKLEPFLLASTLNLVMAQRLVRTICEYCKDRVEMPSDLEKRVRDDLKKIPESAFPFKVDLANPKPLLFFRGKGCPRCGQTGYKGRTTIAEVLEITRDLETSIAEHKFNELNQKLIDAGTLTMRQDGLFKALEGGTTVEEVFRATQE